MTEAVSATSTCRLSTSVPKIHGKELQKGEHPTQALTLISNDHGYVETLSTKQDRSTSAHEADNPKIFDETSRKMWGDPLFTTAMWNWGFGRKMLWRECERLGFERVRSEIRYVQSQSGIRCKGKYLRKILASMDAEPKPLAQCSG